MDTLGSDCCAIWGCTKIRGPLNTDPQIAGFPQNKDPKKGTPSSRKPPYYPYRTRILPAATNAVQAKLENQVFLGCQCRPLCGIATESAFGLELGLGFREAASRFKKGLGI